MTVNSEKLKHLFLIPSICGVSLGVGISSARDVRAQDYYTGTPTYDITSSDTLYDGIGTVTPLEETSLLERLLELAPSYGIYANIAANELQREWYATDRVEVSYQDTIADVTTTETGGLAYSTLVEGPQAGEVSAVTDVGTGSELDLDTIQLARVTAYNLFLFWRQPDGSLANTPPNFDWSTPADYAHLFYQGDYPGRTGYVDLTTGNFPADGTRISFNPGSTLNTAYLNSDGTVDLVNQQPNSPVVVLLEFPDGTSIVADTLPDVQRDALLALYGDLSFTAQSSPTPSMFISDSPSIASGEIPASIDLSGDVVGDFSGTSTTISTTSLLSDYLVVYEEGNTRLVSRSYAEENNLLGSISYDVTEYNVPSTTQFNSYYEDWWQRELPGLLDASVTNTISGMSAERVDAIVASIVAASSQAEAGAASSSTVRMPTLPALAVFSIEDISTTGIGSMNSGEIDLAMQSTTDQILRSSSEGGDTLVETLFLTNSGLGVMPITLNVAHNAVDIQANVTNSITDANGSFGNIATTAIGAMNSGNIISNASNIVERLVGSSTN